MHLIRPLGSTARGASLLVGTLAWGVALAGFAAADPLPLPSTDFALTANLTRGGTMDLAHSQSKMRVQMNNPNAPGPMIGLIDLQARKMIMMMPNVKNMAIEIEIPPEYSIGALSGNGTRVGQSEVAGEPCDLWKVEPQANLGSVATTACITTDGIALRTEAEIKGKRQVVYEATQVTRAPQDPSLFELPKDVQVVKVPKGKLGGALGLPGLGGAIPALR